MPNGRRALNSREQAQRTRLYSEDRVRQLNAVSHRVDPTAVVVPPRDITRSLANQERTSLSSLRQDPRLAGNRDLIYYPAYCHKASPTWFEWVRLTACDIHTKLQIKDEYQHSWLAEHPYQRDSPQLTFYLNHPIQFVQVVGVVVAFDEYLDRIWLFTIDDSSGMTIDVVCRKPAKEEASVAKIHYPASKGRGADDDDDEEKRVLHLSALVSGTVEIGAVLQVKGVITLFQRYRRDCALDNFGNRTLNRQVKDTPTRQISLQRLAKVHDTNQEIDIIEARTQFHNTVLAKPWSLSRKEQHKLHKVALGETEHGKKKAEKLVEKRKRLVEEERKDEEAIQQEWRSEEIEREKGAELARQAGLQLSMSIARKRSQEARTTLPRQDLPSAAPMIQKNVENTKSHEKKRAKRQKDETLHTRDQSVIEPVDTTNDSFAALESEKSALLKAAFG